MTKQDLINLLNGKFSIVPEPRRIDDSSGIRTYLVSPIIKTGDIMYSQTITFYVENEGQGNENAYWGGSEPRPTIIPTFTQRVQDFINQKIQVGNAIKFAWIVSSNENQKKAYISGFSPTNVPKNGIISDDGSGNLSIELF